MQDDPKARGDSSEGLAAYRFYVHKSVPAWRLVRLREAQAPTGLVVGEWSFTRARTADDTNPEIRGQCDAKGFALFKLGGTVVDVAADVAASLHVAGSTLRVRPMRLDEVGVRIDYFHDASDEQLARLGVDRARLPERSTWREFYESDDARPLTERLNYSLVWELDGVVVGFSSTDNITFGVEAFMHLHILDSNNRRRGMGTEFVRASTEHYFDVLQLQHLYCQPNAYNVAPNRTLQRAGFRYECALYTAPSEMNFPQPVTRWGLHRPAE